MGETLAFEAALSAQNFLNGIRQMITGMNQADAAAQKSGSTISSGLEKSLLSGKGNFSKVGQEIGGTLTQGMTAQFGMAGNVAGSLATALGPVGIAGLAAGAGIAAIGISSVGVAASFQQSMANVQSVLGGSQADFEALSAVAREAGATTVFSASEAANALYFMASAGFNAKQSGDALKGVLNLASAGQMDLARASEIVTSSIAQFGLKAEDAGRVSNVLAAGASKTNSDILQLGSGMNYVGPVAAALGYSIEETTAALGMLANAGLKGEQGGTMLRGSLAALMSPSTAAGKALGDMGLSIEAVNPATHSLSEIIQVLGEHGLTATQAVQIFGRESASGMLALVSQGAPALEELTAGITGTNKAAEMAAIQNATYQGSMKMLSSAVEEVQISLGNMLLPTLTAGVSGFAALVTAATSVGQALYGLAANSAVMQSLGEAATSVGEAIGSTFGNLVSVISPVWEALSGGQSAMSGLQGAFDVVTMPLNALVQGIKLLADGIKTFQTTAAPVAAFIGTTLGGAITTGKAYLQAFTEAISNMVSKSSTIQTLVSAFESMKTGVMGVIDGVKEAVQGMVDWIGEKFQWVVDEVAKFFGNDLIGGLLEQAGLGNISKRAKEIVDAGKQIGDKTAEGIEKSEDLANAPGEVLSSDAAMKGVGDAGGAAAKEYENQFQQMVGQSGGLDSAGKKIASLTSEGLLKIINSQSSDADIQKSIYDLYGKTVEYWYDAAETYSQATLKIGDVQITQPWSKTRASPQDLLRLIGLSDEAVSQLKVDSVAKLENIVESINQEATKAKIDLKFDFDMSKAISYEGGGFKSDVLRNMLTIWINQAGKDATTEGVRNAAQTFGQLLGDIDWKNLGGVEEASSKIKDVWANMFSGGSGGREGERQGEVIDRVVQAYKDKLVSGIVDVGKFMETTASDIGGQISQALSDGFMSDQEISSLAAFEPMLRVLRDTFPEEFKDAGLDSIMAFIEAAKAGSSPEELYALGQKLGQATGEGFKDSLTGAMLGIGQTKTLADIIAGASAGIGDLAKFKTNTFLPALKTSFNEMYEISKSGYEADMQIASNWVEDKQKVLSEHSDWFASWQRQLLTMYENNQVTLQELLDVWNAVENASDKVVKATDKQAVGYDNLKKTIEDCSDCAISEFGEWQEAQEGLFSGSYLGQGGAAYEDWKTNQIQAIAETQEAMKRMGGVVVGKDYTQQWAEMQKLQIDTSEADSKLVTSKQNLQSIIDKANEGMKLALNTDVADANLKALLANVDANRYQTMYVETIHYDTYAGAGGAGGYPTTWENDLAASAQSQLQGLLGGFQEGTDYVPQTGPYLLHKGEAVIPEGKNAGGVSIEINAPLTVQGDINGVEDYEELLDKRDAALRKEFTKAIRTVAKA